MADDDSSDAQGGKAAAVAAAAVAVTARRPARRTRKAKATSAPPVQETLDPPHDLPHVLLPPQDQAAAAAPSATDAIVKVYSAGIEFADQMAEVMGYLATFAVVSLSLPTIFWLTGPGGFWDYVFVLFLTFVLLVMIREDFHGQRYNPVLFNRALGQVHVMETLPLGVFAFFFKPWKVAGDTRIHTYAWDCARAEVVRLMVFQGHVARTEHNLVIAFTESPGSRKVVYRAAVGTTTAYDGGQGCVARWEHIRRYMRGEGPAFRAGDRPWTSGAVSFWRGFFYAQMLLGPGSGEFWKSKKPWVYALGVLTIPLIPFTAYHGLILWACYAVRRQPKWPAEIAASIGPAMRARQLKQVALGEIVLGAVTAVLSGDEAKRAG